MYSRIVGFYRDPQFFLKTDYENSVINFIPGGGIVRLSKYSFDARYYHREDAGGAKVAKALAAKYPEHLYASGSKLRVRHRQVKDRPRTRPRLDVFRKR